MHAKASKRSDESVLRSLIDQWVRAVNARDLDGTMRNYAEDVVVFDLMPPLRTRGREALRKTWAGKFAAFEGPLGLELHDLEVVVDEDSAFSFALNRMKGTQKDGAKADNWMRATIAYRRVGDGWQVVHEHISVPFEGATGRAALDLKP